MTREKPDSKHRRVIVDLRFPPDHSINAGVTPDTYLGTPFLLTLPTIDDITKKIIKLGRGSLLYKIDVSRAFRHVKMDPKDYSLLGLRLQDYFIDTYLPFGLRHGSAMFQRLSDAVHHIMTQKGYQVTNYAIMHLNTDHSLAFLEFLVFNQLSQASINNYLSAIKTMLQLYGIQSVAFRDHRVSYLMKALKLQAPLRVTLKSIIDIALLNEIVTSCNSMYMGQIYKACFLTSFFPFLRISNLVP